MESETSPSANADRHPWAIWELVSTAPRWLLHRGYPPVLDHPRFSVRLLRMSMVIAGLCMLCDWVYAVVLTPIMAFRILGHGIEDTLAMAMAGGCFGIFVLIPVSRWQGRNWLLTIAAVPVTVIPHYLAVLSFLPWAYNQPYWVYRNIQGSLNGIFVGLCLIPPLSFRAIGMNLLSAMAGIAGYYFATQANALLGKAYISSSVVHQWGMIVLRMANAFFLAHLTMALVLGLWLAWQPCRRSGTD